MMFKFICVFSLYYIKGNFLTKYTNNLQITCRNFFLKDQLPIKMQLYQLQVVNNIALTFEINSDYFLIELASVSNCVNGWLIFPDCLIHVIRLLVWMY